MAIDRSSDLFAAPSPTQKTYNPGYVPAEYEQLALFRWRCNRDGN